MNEFELVAQMNNAFGNNTPNEHEPFSWERIHNQCKNIKDEINELDAAIAEKDSTNDNERDANCDIRVFTIGAAHLMGVDLFANLGIFGTDMDKTILAMVSKQKGLDKFVFAYKALMTSIQSASIIDTVSCLCVMMQVSDSYAKKIGQDIEADMKAVIDGNMTRFVKDDADREATVLLHASKGVTDVYFEGMYPTMVMKSGSHQPDAPTGKFLKSASYTKPVFAPRQSVSNTDAPQILNRRASDLPGQEEMDRLLGKHKKLMADQEEHLQKVRADPDYRMPEAPAA